MDKVLLREKEKFRKWRKFLKWADIERYKKT